MTSPCPARYGGMLRAHEYHTPEHTDTQCLWMSNHFYCSTKSLILSTAYNLINKYFFSPSCCSGRHFWTGGYCCSWRYWHKNWEWPQWLRTAYLGPSAPHGHANKSTQKYWMWQDQYINTYLNNENWNCTLCYMAHLLKLYIRVVKLNQRGFPISSWLYFTVFLRLCAWRVFIISVWKAATTACLLVFRISSRWRSTNTSAAAHVSEQKSHRPTMNIISIRLSPTYNIGELDCKRVTELQLEKHQEALLQRGNAALSLSVLILQLLHCVDDASTVYNIWSRAAKYKRLKK